MSDIIQKLEAMAQEYEEIARDAREHAEALKRILGGEIAQVSPKPKRYVSPETRQRLRERTRASWAKRKGKIA